MNVLSVEEQESFTISSGQADTDDGFNVKVPIATIILWQSHNFNAIFDHYILARVAIYINNQLAKKLVARL